MILYTLIGLAEVLDAQRHTVCAATLAGSAETLCTATGPRPWPGERAIWDGIVAAVRGQLSETDYRASWLVGRVTCTPKTVKKE